MKVLFRQFMSNPKLKNSFLQSFCNNLTLTDKYENDQMRSSYRFRVPESAANLQGTMHGGAISSLVDISTTISILKLTPVKNASISLQTEYFSPVLIGEQIVVQTFIMKAGKSIVFTECEIYLQGKLAAKGSHTKSFAKVNWEFLDDKT